MDVILKLLYNIMLLKMVCTIVVPAVTKWAPNGISILAPIILVLTLSHILSHYYGPMIHHIIETLFCW